jgi:hypothetical protein
MKKSLIYLRVIRLARNKLTKFLKLRKFDPIRKSEIENPKFP